jgi:hypothetical protein
MKPERLLGDVGICTMDDLSNRSPSEWSDLARDDPKQAAKDLDRLAARARKPGDKLGQLAASLREDTADRLRGGPGTIPTP